MTSGINPALLIEPEMLDELMSTSWIIRIATKGPGPRINLTPLWFVWVEGLVYVFCRGQKLANLRRDPNVTVLVDRNERYDELQGAMIQGLATVLEDVSAEAADPLLERAQATLATKYAGGRKNPRKMATGAEERSKTRLAPSRWVRIEPTHIVGWDNSKPVRRDK